MFKTRPSGALLGALSLLVLAGCVDSSVVSPDIDATPSFAISDGSTGQGDDFYFLPPLADGNPNPVGEFNPNLRPTIRVCEISQSELGLTPSGGKPTCDEQGRQIALEAGALVATPGQGMYTLSWDTDGQETGNIRTNRFLLLEVLVGGVVQGWIDLDPQNPNGPGQSTFDAYAFRVGETIPVKFFLSTDVLCTPSAFVTECITGVAVNQDGATLSLEDEGNKLGLIIFQNSLPSPFDEIVVTVERIDPVLFQSVTGEECIPGGFGLGDESMFDAPQFGDCFRVTTVPEVTTPLVTPALVSICLDPTSFAGIDLTQQQQDQLTMVRYDDIDVQWEALADAAGDCPTTTASLLDVPESGFMRYAAMGINAVADFVAPEPVAARDIRLGGLTGSFSRFRYALPGQMVPTAGDGTVIQASDDDEVVATVNVVDFEGVAVENAIVHFSTADGSVSPDEIVTGADGNATVTWTVDRTTAGEKTLTASALGLVSGAVPEHDANYPFVAQSVTFTATVIGPPSSLAQNPAGPIDDAVAGQPETLAVTVTDAAGNLVDGATVTWTCTPTCSFNGDPSTTQGDGSAIIEVLTGPDGVATVVWTPTSSGSQVSVASVGAATDATFNATVAPAPAVEPTYPTVPATGTAGLTLPDALVINVVDEFGNAREGDEVTWTVGTNSGSVSATSTLVDSDGNAEVTWTLDQMAGVNSLTVALSGSSFSTTLEVTGEPGPAVQPTGTGSGQTGTVGQALPSPLTVTVADQFGNGIAGESVSFMTGDGGSFSSPTAITDVNGVATTTWTLGTSAGAQTATATLGSFNNVFSASAVPGDAANLNATQSSTTGLIGASIDLDVTVTDAFGNPRSGDAVTWSITGGGGSFASSDGTTGSAGSATASWTLGLAPGLNTASVSVEGITETFSVIADCSPGWGTAGIDGAFDTGSEWKCAEMRSFAANISGGSTPAEVYWMNDGTNLYMAVRVFQSSLANVNDIRIDFDNDGDGAPAVGDDAIGYEGEDMVFIDEYLDRRCLNRSQSGCGRIDSSVDGSGAVANDGTWTTFELTHPLSGTPGEDFDVSAGDALGFFLSLQQGNGAQGNTQWPAFRTYESISIVGPGS